MAQGVLPFKYEEEKKATGMTALAGLAVYLDLAQKIGLAESIQKHLNVRAGGQGWIDSQIVIALILLNLAGGDCVEDIKVVEADDGFCEIVKKAELYGLKRRGRRATSAVSSVFIVPAVALRGLAKGGSPSSSRPWLKRWKSAMGM